MRPCYEPATRARVKAHFLAGAFRPEPWPGEAGRRYFPLAAESVASHVVLCERSLVLGLSHLQSAPPVQQDLARGCRIDFCEVRNQGGEGGTSNGLATCSSEARQRGLHLARDACREPPTRRALSSVTRCPYIGEILQVDVTEACQLSCHHLEEVPHSLLCESIPELDGLRSTLNTLVHPRLGRIKPGLHGELGKGGDEQPCLRLFCIRGAVGVGNGARTSRIYQREEPRPVRDDPNIVWMASERAVPCLRYGGVLPPHNRNDLAEGGSRFVFDEPPGVRNELVIGKPLASQQQDPRLPIHGVPGQPLLHQGELNPGQRAAPDQLLVNGAPQVPKD